MKRLLPFIILILIVLGLLIGVPLLMQPDSHRSQVADYLSQKLGQRVVIGKLSASFLPPQLRMHDVSVLSRQDAVVLRVERVDVTPDWGHLFKLKVVPTGLAFNRWLLTVNRRADGTWDWSEWYRPASNTATSAGWPIKKIAWRDGEVAFKDPFNRKPQDVRLQGVEGQLDLPALQANMQGTLSAPGVSWSTSFNGHGEFLGGLGWSGDLRLTDGSRQWSLHLDKKDQTLEAKGQAGEWRADSLWNAMAFYFRWPSADLSSSPPVIKDWKTAFLLHNSSMTFVQSATLGGGLAELKGDMTGAGNHAAVTAAGTLQDVPVGEIAKLTGQSFLLEGKLSGFGRFQVEVASQPWASITGQGEGTVRDGRFRFPESTLRNLQKAKTTGYMNAKYPAFATQGIPFRRFHVLWQASRGTINVSRALLDAGNVKAGAAGVLDAPRRGAELFTRLQIQESDPALRRLIPAHYVYQSGGQDDIQPIYGRLQGSWSEWSVRAVSASRIPGSRQSAIREAVAQ